MAPSLERLKKPVGELLMHMGETYRQTQEKRELIDRALPTQHDGKVRTQFPSPCEEGVWTQGWLPAQWGQIYPLQSMVEPSRPLQVIVLVLLLGV